jgi:hypothetical protein
MRGGDTVSLRLMPVLLVLLALLGLGGCAGAPAPAGQ